MKEDISLTSTLIDIDIKKIGRLLYLFNKRIFDIIVSIFGIILLIPISIVVKILYLINKDSSSIFYSQYRIGKNGKNFKLYKFRTMHKDADKTLYELLESNPLLKEEYELNKKLVNDPRITKVGKILRKCSLDELPQMINVFIGNMSLIGNRPYLPREKDDMAYYFKRIVSTKPGITGVWQTEGRSNTTFKTRLKLETKYSKEMCFKVDAKIFFKTFVSMFKGV